MANFDIARALLREFKGDTYLHGVGVLPQVGQVVDGQGRRAALVRGVFAAAVGFVGTIPG